MKKIAIMTINSQNYGNRLQNYALQQVIRSLGYQVETVRRTKKPVFREKLTVRVKRRIKALRRSKTSCFAAFDRKYMSFSKYHASPDVAEPWLEDAYDAFVVGSDQVWNPHYRHVVGDCDLLTFVRDQNKIAYAASVGVDEIPKDQRERYASAWSAFDALSVREQAGAALVKEISGRDAAVTLDPTLLIGAEQWKTIERQPAILPKKEYVLLYSLGGTSELMNAWLNACREEGKLEIVDVMKKGRDGKAPQVGPSEFLYLIRHAQHVVTNSFHALVFASIFHRPVKVFPRAGIDMSSRIATFAQTVGLEQNFSEDGVFSVDRDAEFAQIDARIGD